MKLHKAFQDKRGFTLTELLIVTALMALLLGMSILIGYDSIARSNVANERDLFISLLDTARAKALANVDETPHGLHVGTESYILFEGGAPGGASDVELPRSDSVTITGPDGTTDPFDVIFKQLSADVSKGEGTITLSGSNQSATIDINEYGRIDW